MKKATRVYLLCVLLLLTTTACENKRTDLPEKTIGTEEIAITTPIMESTSVPSIEVTATQDMESTSDIEESDELSFEQYGEVKEVEKTFYSHKDKEQEVYHYTIEQFFF